MRKLKHCKVTTVTERNRLIPCHGLRVEGHFKCHFQKLVERHREYRPAFIRENDTWRFFWNLSREKGEGESLRAILKQMDERRDANLVHATHTEAVFFWRPLLRGIVYRLSAAQCVTILKVIIPYDHFPGSFFLLSAISFNRRKLNMCLQVSR